MGYFTSVRGEIRISPPVPWGQVKDSPFLPSAVDADWRDVQLRIAEETVDTDEGQLIRRAAVAVIPSSEDSYKAYDIEDHLQQLVNMHGHGRTFAGRLEGEGEENGDMWRLYVRDGKVVKEVPRIVWPDGEVVEGRSR